MGGGGAVRVCGTAVGIRKKKKRDRDWELDDITHLPFWYHFLLVASLSSFAERFTRANFFFYFIFDVLRDGCRKEKKKNWFSNHTKYMQSSSCLFFARSYFYSFCFSCKRRSSGCEFHEICHNTWTLFVIWFWLFTSTLNSVAAVVNAAIVLSCFSLSFTLSRFIPTIHDVRTHLSFAGKPTELNWMKKINTFIFCGQQKYQVQGYLALYGTIKKCDFRRPIWYTSTDV